MEGKDASIERLMSGLESAELYETSEKMKTYMQEGILCNSFIKELSRHIGSDLKKLAKPLRVDKTEFDAIEYRDPRDLKEQIVQFFRYWEEREGSRASVDMLMDALKRAELSEVTDRMDLFLRQVKEGKTIEKSAFHPQISHNEATRSASWQPSQRSDILKTESFKTTKPDTGYFRKRCQSEAASGGGRNRQSSGFRRHSNNLDIRDDNETQLVFFCSETAANDLQGLAKGTSAEIKILSSRLVSLSPMGEVMIRGTKGCCCEVLSKYLTQKLSSSQCVSKKSVPIDNQHQFGQVVGQSGCVHKAIKSLSGADMWIGDCDSNTEIYPKTCHVKGHPVQVKKAEGLLRRAMQGDDITREATPHNILLRIRTDLTEFCGFQFEETDMN